MRLWRTRIAHHDSLLDQNLKRRPEEMIGVANAIDSARGEVERLGRVAERTGTPAERDMRARAGHRLGQEPPLRLDSRWAHSVCTMGGDGGASEGLPVEPASESG